MTDQKHPLTLQDIADLSTQRLITAELCDDMRDAYDRGRGDQLKQVIKWLEDNTSKYVYHDYYGADEQQELFKCLEDLQKAMRPTTQEDK